MDSLGHEDALARALKLNQEAFRLYQRGQFEPALRLLTRATNLLRGHPSGPEVRAAMAMSLTNRSNCLLELGQSVSAVAAAVDAADLYRDIAEDDSSAPMRFRYAQALNNLRHCAEHGGDNRRALEASDQCVRVYRGLVEEESPRAHRALADALAAHGRVLARASSWDEALVAFQQALELLEQLAGEGDREAQIEISILLTDTALVLRSLGRRDEAAEMLAESLQKTSAVSSAQADAMLGSRARALANRASSLAEEGRIADALLPAGEAVVIFRGLAERDPGAYTPELAAALNNQSNRLSENGYAEEALHAVEEAVALRRRLAREHPETRAPELVTSLTNLSNRHREAGRGGDALLAADEAVLTGEAHARTTPGGATIPLVSALLARALLLEARGAYDHAFRDAERAAAASATLLKIAPRALPDRGRRILDAYCRLAEAARRTVDERLVAQLAAIAEHGKGIRGQ
jgi:tetratricopeptide (TPR) repeat protein